jgi:hypothetical protein
MEQLQGHIWGRASKHIYEEMRKYLTIYEEAISLELKLITIN